MVHTDHRPAERRAEPMRDAGTDEQRTNESRADRDCNRVDLARSSPRLHQNLVEQRQYAPDVVTRCQFGNHAAIGAMHIDLRMDRVRQQAKTVVKQREPGLIAGGFDAENEHGPTTSWVGGRV